MGIVNEYLRKKYGYSPRLIIRRKSIEKNKRSLLTRSVEQILKKDT